MEADATVQPNGLLRLTDQKPNTIGTTLYRKAVRLLESHRNASVRSFSTCIVFAINPTSSKEGGYGFTFTLSPIPDIQDVSTTNENPRNHVFAVGFDTVQGFEDGYHRMGNHVGVNFNSLQSDFEGHVLFYKREQKEELLLQTGEPVKADILYDGNTKLLNITVYLAEMTPSPVRPMISRPVPKLSKIIEEEMYVGFTAATGNGERSSAHYIMGWSFSSGGEHPVAAKLNLSDLLHPPTNTSEKSAYSSKEIGLIVAISAVTLIFIVLLVYFFIYKKRGETLEDWEVNHPHRMRYKELHSATDGFSEERIIGYGGFGTVFRGSLSTSLSDRIAVKKITEGSEQGIREFVAEIESLGRLSHKCWES
uniref:Protein kinase domain-containing protein n=2 Tax=Brassica TaxID=3705 RepID=A0A0D3E6R1_BRAOL